MRKYPKGQTQIFFLVRYQKVRFLFNQCSIRLKKKKNQKTKTTHVQKQNNTLQYFQKCILSWEISWPLPFPYETSMHKNKPKNGWSFVQYSHHVYEALVYYDGQQKTKGYTLLHCKPKAELQTDKNTFRDVSINNAEFKCVFYRCKQCK